MTVVNLRAARKARVRADKRAKGDANAVKFGRSKADKQLQSAKSALEQKKLDGARRETSCDPKNTL